MECQLLSAISFETHIANSISVRGSSFQVHFFFLALHVVVAVADAGWEVPVVDWFETRPQQPPRSVATVHQITVGLALDQNSPECSCVPLDVVLVVALHLLKHP